ncbi:chromosome partitioning type protein [Candidatus Symbiobacter mobilis CR]|uniref:Chromosome partitioning type protein n=2 Tax=Candidatus Symbiobacter TaxID=1436289 RepID=U5N8M7_9BURK|nr:chromosome partitioning type protein [Candidatus Symbiobacter mobilis CR]
MKGGVGKTSATANLSVALAATLGGERVRTLDLDPQNALHWHFGNTEDHAPGVCTQSIAGGDWSAIARTADCGIVCLPYGDATEIERQAFESLLAEQPGWIGQQLRHYGIDHDALVLIDTPPGPSVYLRQVFACADLVLLVLMADAGSYAAIPAMEGWLASFPQSLLRAHYLLNQVDRSEALNRDTAAFLRQHLGNRLCPVDIHRDEAVGEALAFQRTVLEYEPHAQASLDWTRAAAWLLDTLAHTPPR